MPTCSRPSSHQGDGDGMAKRGFGRIVNITSSSVKSPIDILGPRTARAADDGFVGRRARPIAAQGVTSQPAGSFDTDRPRRCRRGAEAGQDFRHRVGKARKKSAKPLRHAGEFGAILRLSLQHAGRYMTGQNVWPTRPPTRQPTEPAHERGEAHREQQKRALEKITLVSVTGLPDARGARWP